MARLCCGCFEGLDAFGGGGGDLDLVDEAGDGSERSARDAEGEQGGDEALGGEFAIDDGLGSDEGERADGEDGDDFDEWARESASHADLEQFIGEHAVDAAEAAGFVAFCTGGLDDAVALEGLGGGGEEAGLAFECGAACAADAFGEFADDGVEDGCGEECEEGESRLNDDGSDEGDGALADLGEGLAQQHGEACADCEGVVDDSADGIRGVGGGVAEDGRSEDGSVGGASEAGDGSVDDGECEVLMQEVGSAADDGEDAKPDDHDEHGGEAFGWKLIDGALGDGEPGGPVGQSLVEVHGHGGEADGATIGLFEDVLEEWRDCDEARADAAGGDECAEDGCDDGQAVAEHAPGV